MAVGIILAMVLMLFYFGMFGIAIADYVLTSLSLYTIAKRRQINNPWMAWLPIANTWIVGSIADDYDAQNKIPRKWRVVLLTLNAVTAGALILMYILLFGVLFSTAISASISEYYSPTVEQILPKFIPIYLLMFAMIFAAAASQSCSAVCMFKIFESTVPQKAVKYFLISLLVPLGKGLCLNKCKNKGYYKNPPYFYSYNGMPFITQNGNMQTPPAAPYIATDISSQPSDNQNNIDL